MYNRLFKLWYYTVSHKQMLLRSVGFDGTCNIDIYFEDVSYVEIPSDMKGIEILETTKADIDYIAKKIGNTEKKITVLKCGNHKYFVVSSVVKLMENKLSMFELPFDIPSDRGNIYTDTINGCLDSW